MRASSASDVSNHLVAYQVEKLWTEQPRRMNLSVSQLQYVVVCNSACPSPEVCLRSVLVELLPQCNACFL